MSSILTNPFDERWDFSAQIQATFFNWERKNEPVKKTCQPQLELSYNCYLCGQFFEKAE
jgi:hypothetical protein